MNKPRETLEDVLSYLEGARDNLLTIYNSIDGDCASRQVTLNAVYGVYSHLDFIIEKMAKHIDGIPREVLEAAATRVK